METIKIYKKQEIQSTFNVYHYQKFLAEIFPDINPIIIKFFAQKTDKLYAKIKEFDTAVDDNTITRNIIKQQDVYCEFSDNFSKNSTNIIQSDVIILGKKHNWARFEDVIITKFNNYLHNYPREVLDDSKKLLVAQFQTYMAMKFIRDLVPRIDATFVISPAPKIEPVDDGLVFDPKILSPISIFIQKMYRYDLDTQNFYRLYCQLRSTGMLEALTTTKNVQKLIERRAQEEEANIGQVIKSDERLGLLSSYNLLKKIVAKEYDSTSEVNKILSSKRQMTPTEFYKMIPKKDAEKIKKILGDRLKEMYNTCAHIRLVNLFISGRKYLREQVIELCDIDQNTLQYHCTKCSKRAFCQHHLDLSNTTPSTKMQLINKYKSPELSDNLFYYCKYCYEKIYKNETEFVLTALDVMAITKLREYSVSQDTNIDVYDSGLYAGITTAISCFKINYEYSPQVLARSIKYALYDIVYEQVSKMNIEDDSYLELVAKMCSFIFALVYLRPLFMKDPKITTKSDIKKLDSAYGKFINDEVITRFKNISNSEQVINLIKIAAVRLRDKGVGITRIQAKTDKDNVQEILQSRQFWALYQMYNYGNPGTDALEVFGRLIKKTKPNLGNFTEGMIIPTKNVSEEAKNIYTHLFDYSSPYCYLYNFTENESLSTTSSILKYDPKIYNSLMEGFRATMAENKIKSYTEIRKLKPNNHFRYGVGANYLYDDEGDIITWVPMGPKKDWEHKTSSGKTMFLSKIKKHVDGTTAAKVEARNKKLGFVEAEFVARKPEKYKEVADKPDGSEFEFNKKIIGLVTNLDSKFNQHMVNYLGRTEGHDYQTLIKGQIPDVKSYFIGQLRVNSYIEQLIEEYYSLKNNPLASNFFESNGLDFSKYQETVKKLPNLNITKYRSEYSSNVGYWSPEKFYFWVLESLLLMTEVIIKSGKVGELFCTQFFKNIFAEDKKISKPDEKKVTMSIIENKLDETEYDELADASQKYKALDEIDFEEDEDDINDRGD